MQFFRNTRWFILWQPISIVVCCSCSNPCGTGVAMIRCVDSVSFEFNPPVTARNEISMTVSAGDANYTATFTPSSQTGGLVNLVVTYPPFSMSGATLLETPTIVSYSVIADGSVVASGTVSPSYQQVNKGSGECPEYCTQAVVDVAVTQ